MPRQGAPRGTRPLRWSVDLSPAELAYVEQARAVVHASRAKFVLGMALDIERRLTTPVPALVQARAVLDAESELLEEEDDAAGRDRIGRGGRRPAPRRLEADGVADLHATARRQPESATRLRELLGQLADGDDHA